MKTRIEKDSVGELAVPEDAYYGVHALRGSNNFQISGCKMHGDFVKNITLIKKAAAKTNGKYGYITKDIEKAICTACDEILEGKFDDQFITDAIQGGAGTSVNMNVNEVIANRATELLGSFLWGETQDGMISNFSRHRASRAYCAARTCPR